MSEFVHCTLCLRFEDAELKIEIHVSNIFLTNFAYWGTLNPANSEITQFHKSEISDIFFFGGGGNGALALALLVLCLLKWQISKVASSLYTVHAGELGPRGKLGPRQQLAQ